MTFKDSPAEKVMEIEHTNPHADLIAKMVEKMPKKHRDDNDDFCDGWNRCRSEVIAALPKMLDLMEKEIGQESYWEGVNVMNDDLKGKVTLDRKDAEALHGMITFYAERESLLESRAYSNLTQALRSKEE